MIRIADKIKCFIKRCSDNPGYLKMYMFCRIFKYSILEYKAYNFADRGLSRFSFISYYEGTRLFKKYNKCELDKKNTYKKLRDYYQHDCCLLDGDISEREALLCAFIQKHKCFFAKAFSGASGKGIQKFDSTDVNFSIERFLSEYPDGCLVEEVIEQTPDIATFHPQSVNTLRITTVNFSGEIIAIYPVFHIGTGYNFIDNTPGTSLNCAIDSASGKIISALDGTGKAYTQHPDSGVQLIGFKIPCLKAAVEYAKDMAINFPENVFTGFDMAHTEKGWILVEANTKTSFEIWQQPFQKGFRKELKSIVKHRK